MALMPLVEIMAAADSGLFDRNVASSFENGSKQSLGF